MKVLARFVVLALSLSATADASAGPRPWLAASASFNTYAMDEVNGGIASLNAIIAPASMDEIDSGLGLGLAAGLDFPTFTASLGYDHLPASSDASVGAGGFEYDLAADIFVGRIAYRMPVAESIHFALGIGAGIALASGEFGVIPDEPFTHTRPGPGHAVEAVILGPRVEVSGDAPCFEGFAQGEARLSSRLTLVPAVLYRQARIDAHVEGSEGSGVSRFDYSGFAGRLALRVGLD